MKRFILGAFAFLAFAFYHLSGGGDFDPSQTRQASQETRLNLEAERRAALDAQITALPPVTGTTPLQAPTEDDVQPAEELDLTSFSSVVVAERGELPEIAQDDADTAAPESTTPTEDAALPDIQLTTPATIEVADLPQSDEDARQIGLSGLSQLPQIGQPATDPGFAGSTASASSENVTQAADIRVVAGSRVNLRDGPGIRYGVVDQLDADTVVVVLEDSGSGWVRLRPTEGGPTGWVAEFLLNAR